ALALLRAYRAPRAAALALTLALAAGCGAPGPRAVAYGQEACATCRMTVDDRRFASEVVAGAGKLHVFDSIECAAAFAVARGAAAGAVWVGDWNRPGTLVRADSADFRRLPGAAGSPMGKGLVATRVGDTPRAPGADDAPVLAWADVAARLRAEGLHVAAHAEGPRAR
ncbi:hypothetical protein, partial [Roseisolibacter sp. H3M3-2]|uniref:hypothetical protein n=1 Tax=Roseisolibacter sp. H3M3-2 TaxID=3031323 RepID=UPI0023DA6969